MNSASIIESIQALQWDYEPSFVPEFIHYVHKEDLIMIKNIKSTNVHANRVVRYQQSVENISAVFSYFDGRPFSWWVYDDQGSKALESKLVNHGMVHNDTYIGLAMELNEVLEPSSSTYRIKEVTTPEEAYIHAELSSEVWGYDEASLEAAYKERVRYLKLPERRGGYVLAFNKDKAVGYSSYRHSYDHHSLYLTGAGVIQSERGKGIYRRMVENRLYEARNRGVRLAVTQARVGTSEPILKSLGFEEHGAFKQYISE